jgi:MYXO-CTERM domain-containing protein
MTTRLDSTRRLAGDVALALAAAVLMVLGTSGVSADGSPPNLQGWLLLLAAAAVLVLRRRWPTVVMGTTIVCGLAYTALGNPGAFYAVAIGIGIYTVASTGHRLMAAAGVAGAFGLFLVADLVLETGHILTGGGALWFLGWLTVALLLGEVSRSRSAYITAVQDRAVEAERSRHEQVLRRAGEERIQIAREIHDVLAHSISIINVQAGAALHHLDTDPDQARDALLTVRQTGKQVLRELRSSLGVLRDPNGQIEAPRAPSPGIADIHQLVSATQEAGLSVKLEHNSGSGTVPADVELAAYRIVQEGLTNVTRHAYATAVTVTIDHRPAELIVRIDDNGNGSPADNALGHGITGMKERVAALGGHLHAGPKPEGGFRVEGRIPLGEQP